MKAIFPGWSYSVPSDSFSRGWNVAASAAIPALSGCSVFGLGEGNRAEIRRVTLGQRVGTDWAVTAGLAQGEMVIVSGIQKVQAGIAVTPQPAGN